MASVFLVAAFLAYRMVVRVRTVANVVAAMTGANGASNGGREAKQMNLDSDQMVVFLKHTNQAEVAEACLTYLNDKLRHHLRKAGSEEDNSEGEIYMIMPPHNGYVKFIGSLEGLKDPEMEGLAQHLSQKFDTLAFEHKEVDSSGAFLFGVYEQGTNKFRIRKDVDVKNDQEVDTVTSDGNDWALANGYEPGANGFNYFNIYDANDLTKKFGMKFWDYDEDRITNYVILKERTLKVQTQ